MPDPRPSKVDGKLRIASLQPSVTVTLAALGALDSVVACTRYCADVCPEVVERGIPRIQDSWTAKADEILASKPDLVIASVPYQQQAVAEILKAGARFLGFAPKSLADVYGDVRVLASLVNHGDRGEELIAEFERELEGVRQAVARSPKQKVFCEEWGKPIIASQPWVGELIEACGGELVGVAGQQTTAESVIFSDPEVILAAWCGAGDRVPLEKIVRERGWESTRAAQSGRVFCIADELLNTPALSLVGGLRAIAWALHPDRFPQPSGIRAIKRNTA